MKPRFDEGYYVYIYVDPRDSIPFYVGKGKDLRYLIHTKNSLKNKIGHNKHLFYKIKQIINDLGRQPTILIPYAMVDEKFALAMEKEYIAKFGRIDLKTGSLVNLTHGGDGGAISPEIVKAKTNKLEYKEKISLLAKNYWLNITEEQLEFRKRRVRESYTPELRALKSKKTTEYHKNQTPEQKAKKYTKGIETKRINRAIKESNKCLIV